jgi:hypothetical protein
MPDESTSLTETPVATPDTKAARPLDVLFVLRSLGPIRYFQSTIELLLERGHRVRLLLERDDHEEKAQAWLDATLASPGFTCELVGEMRRDPWQKRGVTLRRGMEYVHFRGPEFHDKQRYVLKALRRSPPPIVRWLAEAPILRTNRGRRALYRILSAIERALPTPRAPVALIDRIQPDIVVFGDSGSRASLYGAFVRAARARAIPTATFVASWDNLTTRPRMREVPDRLLVWNEAQRAEAEALHGVPAERVAVTGAANFDQWFAWRPRPAREFLERVGLDPEKPVVLWVGSAINHWEQPERIFAARWLEAVRTSANPHLREVGILLRPHPLRIEQWTKLDLTGFGNVVMWPREGLSMPVVADQKADYYDSIFHSRCVVGINTSAMIEASIIGRPVLSILEPAHHDSQFGALHFSYLVESGGGTLRLAASLDEHLSDLARIVSSEPETDEAARQFVARFVRPRGIEKPATPIVVETLEELAANPAPPRRDPLTRWALRALVVLIMGMLDGFRQARKRLSRNAKAARRWIRRNVRMLTSVARRGAHKARARLAHARRRTRARVARGRQRSVR